MAQILQEHNTGIKLDCAATFMAGKLRRCIDKYQ